jgi:thymidylate synthase (FAD)
MSSRHVVTSKGDYIIPPTIPSEYLQDYVTTMDDAYITYKALILKGVPIEDARYLIPDGFFTHITLTMNARTLREFFEKRCDKAAQWEIRTMAKQMLMICTEKYPCIFEDLYEKYMAEEY